MASEGVNGEPFQAICDKLHFNVTSDIQRAVSELRSERCSASERTLTSVAFEELAQDIKAEVKMECASLRQLLTDTLARHFEVDPSMQRSILSTGNAVRELQSQMDVNSAILRNLQDGRIVVECAEILEAVETIRKELDLSPILEAIRNGRGVERPLFSIAEEREGRSDIDISPILKEVRQLRAQLADIPMVLKETLDFSPVLAAIEDSRAALDCSQGILDIQYALDDFRETRTSSPVLDELHRVHSRVDDGVSTLLMTLREVLKDVESVKTQVDFSEVLETVREHKPEVDFSEVLKTIREHKPEVDFLPVLEALDDLGQNTCPVDLSPVLTEVQRVRGKVDTGTSTLFAELPRNRGAVGRSISDVGRAACWGGGKDTDPASASAKAIEGLQTEPDFSEVLKTIKEHKSNVDFTPVLSAIDDSRAALDCSHGIKEIQCALREARQGKAEYDLSPVSNDIQRVLHEIHRVHAAVESGLSWVQKSLEERPLVQVIETVRRGKDEFDPLPVLSETQRAHSAVDCGLPSLQKMHGKCHIDFDPVLNEIQRAESTVDASTTVDGKCQSDFDPQLSDTRTQATSASDTGTTGDCKCQSDFDPQVGETQRTQSTADTGTSASSHGGLLARGVVPSHELRRQAP